MEGNQGPKPSYQLINAFESLVKDAVRVQVKKEPGMCQCEKCYMDTCAIVLNSGFTHYVTTAQGTLLVTLPDIIKNREIDLLVAVISAIKKVKEHPNH